MFEHIQGDLKRITPAYAVVETNGIGYFINITLNTYVKINGQTTCFLFLHQIVREDAHLLYGFATSEERELFRQLISVNGVGPNTARMVLSSISSDELALAIINGSVGILKSIKGVGQKTAERIIVDLRDKIGKPEIKQEIFSPSDNTKREEALSALIMLGFNKNHSEKALDKLLEANPQAKVEELVKGALKLL